MHTPVAELPAAANAVQTPQLSDTPRFVEPLPLPLSDTLSFMRAHFLCQVRRVSMMGVDHDVIATRKPGDFFRFSGFASKEAERFGMFKLFALFDSVIIVLKPSDLAEVLPRHAGKDGGLSTTMRALAKADFYMLLKKSPYFSGISVAHLNTLSELFTFECVRPRSALYAKGDTADRFYILVDGELQVSFCASSFL